jgi:hypothetical protein
LSIHEVILKYSETILKYSEIFALYCQIDLYKMDSIYILMAQVDSRLEIAKKVLMDSLGISLEYTEVRNFRFFSPWKNKKIVHDNVVTNSHL